MRLLLAATLLLACPVPPPAYAAESGASAGELVERLGHPVYAERRDARRRLLSRGLEAFDALWLGTEHADPEVAQACQGLLDEMTLDWAWAGDPPDIRALSQDYARAPREARLGVVEALDDAPREEGVPALARLARFEPANRVAREAARELIETPEVDLGRRGEATRDATVALDEAYGPGVRASAEWLALAAAEHGGDVGPDEAAAAWRRLAEREREALASARGETSLRIVQTLHERWLRAALLAGDTKAAAEATDALVALEPEETLGELIQAVRWAIETERWDAADRVVESYADRLAGKRGVYLRAELAAARGDDAEAQRFAEEALAAEAESEGPAMLEALFGPRVIVAAELHRAGLDPWAMAEYRATFEGAETLDGVGAVARWRLSNLLYDAARYAEAADVLRPLAEAIASDGSAYRELPQTERLLAPDPAILRARLHLCAALAAREAGETATEVAELREAIAADDSDADIVIAMHRVADPPPDFALETQRRLEGLKQELESEVWRQAGSPEADESSEPFNQWAWLVANTEGDFEKAVRYSRRSLEVLPETASYLDTLGRCLFAAGRLEEAIEVQRRAIELEPRMQVMRRQLAEFERALAEKQQEADE